MNKFFLSSIAFATFTVSILLFQLINNSKANASSLVNPIPFTKEQILTSKVWKVDKLHHIVSGQYSYYERGVSNTTGIDYDKLRFTFNKNGSGTHINNEGTFYNFKWQFNTKDKRILSLTINGQTQIWDMLEIANKYLHTSANLTIGGDNNNIETFRLIQIP